MGSPHLSTRQRWGGPPSYPTWAGGQMGGESPLAARAGGAVPAPLLRPLPSVSQGQQRFGGGRTGARAQRARGWRDTAAEQVPTGTCSGGVSGRIPGSSVALHGRPRAGRVVPRKDLRRRERRGVFRGRYGSLTRALGR